MSAAASRGSGFRPALLLTAARTVATGFTFMIPVLLARRLPPEVFGAYKQLFLLFMTFYALAQMGMAESLYYFIPLHPARSGRLVANTFLSLAVCALFSLGILTVGEVRMATLLGNAQLAPYLPFLGVFLALMLLSSMLETSMVARQRYSWAGAVYVSSDIVRAILLVGPVLLGAGIRGLLLGACLSALYRLAVGTFFVRREFGGGLVPDASLLRAQLAYALPFQLAVIVETAQATLHQYVVSYKFDAATFALYSIGCLQIPFIDLLAGPAGNVMMVHMADAQRRGDMEALHASFLDTVRKLALFFLPLLGVLVVCAHDLILLFFTSTYEASVPIFRLWCLCVLLAVFPTDCLMRVLAQTRYLVVVNVVRLVLIIALIGPLLGLFGLFGPVIATLLGLALAKVMMLARYRRRLGLGLPQLLPWSGLVRIAATAGVAALAAMVVSAALSGPHLFRLAVLGTSYAAAYGLLLLAGGVLTEGERSGLCFWRREVAAVALSNVDLPLTPTES